MKILLGLDISTTNIGYCVLSIDENSTVSLLEANSLKIGELSGLYKKSCMFSEKMIELKTKFNFDFIIVEESLLSFKKRKSSANIIGLLNRFNGMITYIARDKLQCPVCFVNSTHARKKIGIMISKTDDTKERIFEFVKNHSVFKNYEWPIKIMKSGKRKNQAVFEARCYDISDSFVMCYYGCLSLNTLVSDITIC